MQTAESYPYRGDIMYSILRQKKKFGNPINYMLNYNLKSDQTEV